MLCHFLRSSKFLVGKELKNRHLKRQIHQHDIPCYVQKMRNGFLHVQSFSNTLENIFYYFKSWKKYSYCQFYLYIGSWKDSQCLIITDKLHGAELRRALYPEVCEFAHLKKMWFPHGASLAVSLTLQNLEPNSMECALSSEEITPVF